MKRLHSGTRRGMLANREGIVLSFQLAGRPGNPAHGSGGEVYCLGTTVVDLYPFDEEYLCRLRDRDAKTEEHFVDYFNNLLKAKLRSDGYSESALNDVRQETLYRVLKAIYADRVQNPRSLRSFAYGVCERVEWEYDRGEWQLWQDDYEEFPDVSDDRSPADAPARQAELRETALWVLNKLPDKDRKLLTALFLDEKERDEICVELGTTRDNFRVLLHRALSSARKVLSKGASS
ncbi:MAG TPA: sigma-70 family RNA polymerase sigma factor [Candidatus Angelobacter sp.]|nr:sigma-70 family RNA polymerase sigma factor [Candidatus Angelobacter sp.]